MWLIANASKGKFNYLKSVSECLSFPLSVLKISFAKVIKKLLHSSISRGSANWTSSFRKCLSCKIKNQENVYVLGLCNFTSENLYEIIEKPANQIKTLGTWLNCGRRSVFRMFTTVCSYVCYMWKRSKHWKMKTNTLVMGLLPLNN